MTDWIFFAVSVSLINFVWVYSLNKTVCRILNKLIEKEEQKIKDNVKAKA